MRQKRKNMGIGCRAQRPTAVIRLRIAFAVAAAIGILIAGPLLSVRRQVHLRNVAIRRERLADSLRVCNRRIGQLMLQVQALSAPQRIEQVARERLGMDYPPASAVVIVEVSSRRAVRWSGGLRTLFRRSLEVERS